METVARQQTPNPEAQLPSFVPPEEVHSDKVMQVPEEDFHALGLRTQIEEST